MEQRLLTRTNNSLINIKNAHGVYLSDINDNVFVDGVSNVINVNLGYSQKEIIHAMSNCAHLIPYGHSGKMYNEIQSILANKLLDMLGNDKYKCLFCNSGSECIEVSLRISQLINNSTGMHASFENSYHGSSVGALSISGTKAKRNFQKMLPSTILFKYPQCSKCKTCNLKCLKEIETSIKNQEIKSITIDPMGSNALGAHVLNSCFLKELSDMCKKNNVILILDEITTSIGRTGKYFAFQHYESFEPDIICLSKGLGVGYANIGAVLVNKRIIELLPPNYNLLGNTFNGHYSACAAALKAMDIIEEEELTVNVQKKGETLLYELKKLEKNDIVDEVDGKGLWCSIKFKDSQTHKGMLASQVNQLIQNDGVILLDSFVLEDGDINSHLSVAPPFVISNSELYKLIETIKKNVEKMAK